MNPPIDIFRRPSACYVVGSYSDDDQFVLVTERGVCDDWRLWQKWNWDELRLDIFMGVDADGRFNVQLRTLVKHDAEVSFNKRFGYHDVPEEVKP